MLSSFLYVAVGGAAGAVARYGTGLILSRAVSLGIPVGVITVNIVGSFIMGVFATYAAERGMSHLSPLVMAGFLGGFTTFSAFSLETVNLFEQGQFANGLVYILVSVIGSIMALAAGVAVARMIWT